jgi:hypothetical protein
MAPADQAARADPPWPALPWRQPTSQPEQIPPLGQLIQLPHGSSLPASQNRFPPGPAAPAPPWLQPTSQPEQIPPWPSCSSSPMAPAYQPARADSPLAQLLQLPHGSSPPASQPASQSRFPPWASCSSSSMAPAYQPASRGRGSLSPRLPWPEEPLPGGFSSRRSLSPEAS